MYKCPVCGNQTFPWFKKLRIGPLGYSRCKDCKSKISVSLDEITYSLFLFPLGIITLVILTEIEKNYVGVISIVILFLIYSYLWIKVYEFKKSLIGEEVKYLY